MSSLRTEIQMLAKQLEEEDNAAFDLWTWLPSHEIASEHHGDYAAEFMPTIAEIMREAATHIHRLKTGAQALAPEPCPCGEDHRED